MGLNELATLVAEMRDAQRNFFHTKLDGSHEARVRKDHWLDESRRLERLVDTALREAQQARDPQKHLFA
jgi:hypothetical protein